MSEVSEKPRSIGCLSCDPAPAQGSRRRYNDYRSSNIYNLFERVRRFHLYFTFLTRGNFKAASIERAWERGLSVYIDWQIQPVGFWVRLHFEAFDVESIPTNRRVSDPPIPDREFLHEVSRSVFLCMTSFFLLWFARRVLPVPLRILRKGCVFGSSDR